MNKQVKLGEIIPDRGLARRTYKEFLQLNNKHNQNQALHKDTWMANKQVSKCSTSLVITKMQIKAINKTLVHKHWNG